MSIESSLKSIASSLEALVEKIDSLPSAESPTAPSEEPDTDDILGLDDEDGDDEITMDKLREKLKEFVSEKGAPDAQKLLKKFKAKKLSDVKESDYAKLYEAIDKLL